MPQKSDGTETGWISKYALETSALAADSTGRQAMQDGFLTNEKIADSQITAVKLAVNTLITAIYGTGLYGTHVYG